MSTPSRTKNSEAKLAKIGNEQNRFCGGITQQGDHCISARGHRTNHPGTGRCLLHEGIANGSPVALYEIPAIKERMEEFLYDRNIYSLDREIALLRAYLELYREYILIFKDLDLRKTQEVGIEFTPSELTSAVNTTTKTIAKLVQTKHEIEVGRKFVIDIRVVQILFDKVGTILDSNIEDPGQRKVISDALGNLLLPLGSS